MNIHPAKRWFAVSLYHTEKFPAIAFIKGSMILQCQIPLRYRRIPERRRLPHNNILFDNNLNMLPQAKFANKALFKLFSVIRRNQTISYYLEESTELDKVLNIFIRVNSGGTTLSYSDLLLSFATAQWQEKDAREELNKFMDEVNLIGRGFNVGKDIILKSCLVLSGFSDISFKVDNFNRSSSRIGMNLQMHSEWR